MQASHDNSHQGLTALPHKVFKGTKTRRSGCLHHSIKLLTQATFAAFIPQSPCLCRTPWMYTPIMIRDTPDPCLLHQKGFPELTFPSKCNAQNILLCSSSLDLSLMVLLPHWTPFDSKFVAGQGHAGLFDLGQSVRIPASRSLRSPSLSHVICCAYSLSMMYTAKLRLTSTHPPTRIACFGTGHPYAHSYRALRSWRNFKTASSNRKLASPSRLQICRSAILTG